MKLSHNIKKGDKKDGPLRAAIYIRVSTAKQKKEGHGKEGQREMCMSEIERKKMVFVEEYLDDAVSGTKIVESREGLKRLYNDVTKNVFDAVVVYKVDRLGRSMNIIVEIIDYFTRNNIKIVSCMEDVDTTKSSGLMTLQMFAVIAQYEKNTIGERLMLGRETVLQNRGETGGSIPFGYKRLTEGKKIVISEEQGAIVRAIFKAYEKGIPLVKIANELNSMGIVKSRGKKWYATTISTIIENMEKYEGGIRNNNANGVRWPVILHNKIFLDQVDIEESKILPEVKIAIYIRITNATFEYYAIEQENATKEIAKKYNWDIYKVYRDVEPETNRRDSLTQLIEDMKYRKFNFVIIKDLSRLGKTLNTLSNIFINFLDNEIKLIIADKMFEDTEINKEIEEFQSETESNEL